MDLTTMTRDDGQGCGSLGTLDAFLGPPLASEYPIGGGWLFAYRHRGWLFSF